VQWSPPQQSVILSVQGIQVFGLLERVTIGAYELWIFVTAAKLLRESN